MKRGTPEPSKMLALVQADAVSDAAAEGLLKLTPTGELILLGGTEDRYRFAEPVAANDPAGWADVIKVYRPAGATAGDILLCANP